MSSPLERGGEAPPIHPRDRYRLERTEGPAADFETALSRGRMHHAWLLTGPRGVGKASFAFRCARRLLGAVAAEGFGPLGASPDDPVSRLVASQSHPDLIVIERPDGKRDIPVDEARRLPEFFSKAPALGAFRVAIIDAAEDLNANGANALLKTLEEPSGRGVLFLVSHAPGRLLPTIRSRCRPCRFPPWPEEAILALLAGADADPAAARGAAQRARGSPGRALDLVRTAHPDLDAAVESLMARPERPEAQAYARLAETLRGDKGLERLRYFFDRLSHEVRRRAMEASGAKADRWAAAFERLASLLARTEAVNLDRGEALLAAVSDVTAAGRSAG